MQLRASDYTGPGVLCAGGSPLETWAIPQSKAIKRNLWSALEAVQRTRAPVGWRTPVFFGNEMSASLDLTAADVVGNVLPRTPCCPKTPVRPQAKTGTANLRVQLLRFSRSSRGAVRTR